MDSSKIFALLFLSCILSISSAVPDIAHTDCGSCSQPPTIPTPKTPIPPVTVPKLPIPPVTVPKLPIPPVTVPKLPLPPVGVVPKLPVPPVTVPKLPLPPVGVVPKLPLPPVGVVPKLPLPPVGIPKLPLPPVGVVPKLPLPPVGVVPKLPLPPVGIPKLPLPPVGVVPKLPLPPVTVPKLPVPLPPVTVPVVGPPKGKPCPTPAGKETCPIDTLKLGACVDLLGGLVHIGIGDPAVSECCPIISGLLEVEAAACLCTTLKIKALNLKVYVPIALELLITCGKTPPPGYTCSL